MGEYRHGSQKQQGTQHVPLPIKIVARRDHLMNQLGMEWWSIAVGCRGVM